MATARYIDHGITLYKATKIVAIDRAAKTVTSDHGVTESYDRAGDRHRLRTAPSSPSPARTCRESSLARSR